MSIELNRFITLIHSYDFQKLISNEYNNYCSSVKHNDYSQKNGDSQKNDNYSINRELITYIIQTILNGFYSPNEIECIYNKKLKKDESKNEIIDDLYDIIQMKTALELMNYKGVQTSEKTLEFIFEKIIKKLINKSLHSKRSYGVEQKFGDRTFIPKIPLYSQLEKYNYTPYKNFSYFHEDESYNLNISIEIDNSNERITKKTNLDLMIFSLNNTDVEDNINNLIFILTKFKNIEKRYPINEIIDEHYYSVESRAPYEHLYVSGFDSKEEMIKKARVNYIKSKYNKSSHKYEQIHEDLRISIDFDKLMDAVIYSKQSLPSYYYYGHIN